MTDSEFKSRLKSGVSGAYLFIGEEEYLKRYYRDKLREKICDNESFASFNIFGFDMCEKTPEDAKAAIDTPPFMNEKKLIEISGIDYNTVREGMLEELCEIADAAKQSGDTILLLYALSGELDTVSYRSKPLEKIRKKLAGKTEEVLFSYSPASKLTGWVDKHFNYEGVFTEPLIVKHLIDRCGQGMDTLDGEIIKLSSYVKAAGRDTVTMADVDAVTTASGKEDTFAMANALLKGDMEAAFEALRILRDANEKPTAVLSRITRVYADMVCVKEISSVGGAVAAAKKMKMNEYKAKLYAKAVFDVPAKKLEDILALCISADIELKSGGADFIPVERLLCSIGSGGGMYGKA